ncbi:AraC family transcriptional regulator [Streptomyces poonensis]|uniref:HTH araC/xylS-type domain-containing protein n=1 Tax=Streptomyces poonensis TaxID=68255 RepID=A0A918PTC3_9ACTN|nr:helix-turn-helix transcriptional regulator [Streptomyces poonensis]GGZ22539.1 hypothetical protein GCM10010365_48470 [Streptomyces poonensis]GLJ91831.1 hypothetical protein GCM10017589_44390 [Streptomyces poonensis]
MPVILDSTDPDVTGEAVSRLYARVRVIDRDGRHRVRLTQDSIGPVTLHWFDYHCDVDFVMDPLTGVVLLSATRGALSRLRLGGYEGRVDAGQVVCFPPGLPSAGQVDHLTHDCVILPPALLDKVAAAAPGRTPQPIRLTGCLPVAPAGGRFLRQTIAYLRDAVHADPRLYEEPLIASTASQLLAATVLAVFPSTVLTEPTIDDRNDAHPATLRRALSYIEDHADEDISVADIAAAARISVRTVQYAFRRHLDTTPMRHLRRVRLAQAHGDLLAADPTTGVTVTAVAGRWGFFHSGQFAAAYRRAYGCPPHRTLRQESP